MAGIPRLYTFKCKHGHLMDREFPPGTCEDDEDETVCEDCLKNHAVQPAYVVFIRSKPSGEKLNGRTNS